MAILHNTEYRGSKRWIYKLIVGILVIGVPLQVFPYLWMITTMLKTPMEVSAIPFHVLPKVPQWSNVIETFLKYHLWTYIGNTLLYAFVTIAIQCTFSALAAFALSKLRIKGASYILLFFLGSMMMSDNVLVIPLYLTFVKFPIFHFSLIDTPFAVILAHSAWAWTVFMFKGFFDGIPFDLIEASRIDGSSNLRTFTKIVLPLSKPVIAVVALQTFVAMYNSLIFPLTFLSKESLWTIMQKIYVISLAWEMTWPSMMVMLAFATIPVIIVYIFSQRYIVEGITMTGIKG